MVKFKTKFDQNTLIKMNQQALKKLWKMYPYFAVIFSAIGLIFLLNIEKHSDLFFGVLCLAFGIVYIPLVILLSKKFVRKQVYQTPLLGAETFEEYTFEKDKMHIVQASGTDYSGTTDSKYNHFYLVVETKTDYFFYIAKNQAHVVPKDSLIEGSLEELNEILRENMGPKFKELKKKSK